MDAPGVLARARFWYSATMDLQHAREVSRRFASLYRVRDGQSFRLRDVDPGDTAWLTSEDKPRAKDALSAGVEWLAKLQDVLYADDRWSVLIILQAMDAAGKDGVIKHVMSGVNPQGCHVTPFKAPSAEELDHDYLWRCVKRLPGRGQIGIFNRSYYEDVLIVRVHEHILRGQKLPPELVTADLWERRYRQIRAFERHLRENGTIVLKFFLHLSKGEQKKRFLERIDRPEKNWKFSISDATERQHWDRYQRAYEEMIRATATKRAPWWVVPADNKWFTRIVVGAAILEAMASLELDYPTVGAAKLEELAEARRELMAESE